MPPGDWLCLHMQDLKLQARPGSPGVWHGKVELLCHWRKPLKSRSQLISRKSWVVNLHCPQAQLSSCQGRDHQTIYHSYPLLQHGLLVHCGLTVKKAANRVPPPLEEPGLKSQPGHLPPNPKWDQRDQIQWNTPEVDPCRNVKDSPCPLVEDPHAQWQDDDVFSCPMQKPFAWLIVRQWHSGYPRANRKQQDGGPLCSPVPGLHLGDYMPSPASSISV